MLKMFQKIEGIPWYRRRWFWGIVVIFLLVTSSIFSWPEIAFNEFFLGKIIDILFLPGSTLFVLLLDPLFEQSDTTNTVGLVTYVFFAVTLLYVSFNQPKVRLAPLFLYLANFAIGSTIFAMLVGYGV